MLQVSLWSRLVTIIVVVAGILIALPNALSPAVRARFPAWLPSSAVNLGLDLQGGSYLLLQVDFDQVTRDPRRIHDRRYPRRLPQGAHPADRSEQQGRHRVGARHRSVASDDARALLQSLNPTIGSSVLSVGGKQYDMAEPGNGVFVLKMTDAFKTITRQQVMDQSIEVVRRRIDELGTREPGIERSGEDRILVQVPACRTRRS